MGHFSWVLETRRGGVCGGMYATEILGGDSFQLYFLNKAFSLAHGQKPALTFGYHI